MPERRGLSGGLVRGSKLVLGAWLVSLLAPGPGDCQEPAELVLDHRQWTTRDGLPHNTVTSIVKDTTGYLWLGTVEGLVRFDGEVFTVFDTSTTPELQNNFINALLATEDGGLWIGTRKGLNRYQRGIFSLYTETDGLAGEVIEDLAMGSEGELWIGTRSGLSRLAGGRLETFGPAEGLAGSTIFALAVDHGGDLWIGAMEGLSRLSEGGFALLGPEEGLTDNFVVSLHPGPGTELWAGTVDGGLLQIDADRFRARRALPRQDPRLVFSLLRDAGGALWIGTRTGLERISGSSLEQVPQLGGDLVMTLFEDPSRRLWVGTLQNGLHCLWDPSRPPAPSSPVIVLESLSVQQESYLVDQRIHFPKGRADVEFRYAAIDFETPGQTRFRHLLEGYDDHWVDAGRQRYAAYTNLPPGSYRFRVRSGRALENGAQATYSFKIPATFRQTRAFKVLLILGAVAGLWGLVLLSVRRLLRTRLLLQREISVQTRELLRQKGQLEHFHRRLDEAHAKLQETHRELKRRNREKSDFLAIATHDLRAPLVNLKGFTAELRFALAEVKDTLEPSLPHLDAGLRAEVTRALEEEAPEAVTFIETSAHKMEAVIGPILKVSRLTRRPLRIQPVSLADCLEQAVAKARDEIESSGARVQVATLPGVLADPGALEEVFFQLLSNAIQMLESDRPGKIEILARREEERILVSVRDNGRSLEKHRAAQLFQPFRRPRDGTPSERETNLGYARILIQRHGGRLWHSANLSIGNTFYFSIPRKPAAPVT